MECRRDRAMEEGFPGDRQSRQFFGGINITDRLVSWQVSVRETRREDFLIWKDRSLPGLHDWKERTKEYLAYKDRSERQWRMEQDARQDQITQHIHSWSRQEEILFSAGTVCRYLMAFKVGIRTGMNCGTELTKTNAEELLLSGRHMMAGTRRRSQIFRNTNKPDKTIFEWIQAVEKIMWMSFHEFQHTQDGAFIVAINLARQRDAEGRLDGNKQWRKICMIYVSYVEQNKKGLPACSNEIFHMM